MTSKVRLEIYNILGQLMKILVDEEKERGFYKTQWDGTNMRGKHVPSGLYFFRLQAGDYTEVKKMTLMK